MSEFLVETERLLLRRWREDDLVPFQGMNADPRVMEFMPKLLKADESSALVERIERHFEERGFGLMAAELKGSGEFIGFVGLSVPEFEAQFMPAVEIGWRLAAGHWGRGLATEAAREALRYGFRIVWLESVVSFTVPENVRSRRVMEKIGMRLVGEFEHPRLPHGDALRRHVLYRVSKKEYEDQSVERTAANFSATAMKPRSVG